LIIEQSHGTHWAYKREMKEAGLACDECAEAKRAYDREWARKKRADRPRRALQPCGTSSAARRHRQRGEEVCVACLAAEAAEARARYAARKAGWV
jgi:hypothetical protein